MNKPYLIVNVVEGILGTIYCAADFETAVDIAVKVAAEQCDVPANEIKEEFESDLDFLAPDGDIHVHITQWEDEYNETI